MRILYAQRCKDILIPTMEEWLVKVMEFGEMAKLTVFIKEKKQHLVSIWRLLLDFVLKTEKKGLILSFDDYNDLLS